MTRYICQVFFWSPCLFHNLVLPLAPSRKEKEKEKERKKREGGKSCKSTIRELKILSLKIRNLGGGPNYIIFLYFTRKILLSDGDVYIPILHKIDTLLNNNKISHSCIRHDHLINPVCINVTDKQLSTKDVQCIPIMYDCEAVCRIKSYKGVHL